VTSTFKPTSQQREDVELLVLTGSSEEEIASALGITRPTLRKHFASELLHGRARKRRVVVRYLFAAARRGNVAAQKALLALSHSAPEQPPKARPLGKKAQAEREAAAPPPDSWAELLGEAPERH
jgi:AcrR family transcriptional regulator